MSNYMRRLSKIFVFMMFFVVVVFILEFMIINAVLGCYSGNAEYCVTFNQIMGIN